MSVLEIADDAFSCVVNKNWKNRTQINEKKEYINHAFE